MGTKYGYMRDYSYQKKTEGNSLKAQRKALEDAGAKVLFKDSLTGTKTKRTELSKLLSMLNAGDTLIVTSLDKLSTSASEVSLVVKELVGRGVTVDILNMQWPDDSTHGTILTTVLQAFAEFEKEELIERCQLGRAEAREKGKRVDGRRVRYSEVEINQAMALLNGANSLSEIANLTGISASTLVRAKRRRKMLSALSAGSVATPSAREAAGHREVVMKKESPLPKSVAPIAVEALHDSSLSNEVYYDVDDDPAAFDGVIFVEVPKNSVNKEFMDDL